MDMFDVHTCLYMDLQATPLFLACYWGNVAAAKELVKKGAKVTAQNEKKLNCLDIAVDRGHEYVDQCTIFVQYIRQHGSAVDVIMVTNRIPG